MSLNRFVRKVSILSQCLSFVIFACCCPASNLVSTPILPADPAPPRSPEIKATACQPPPLKGNPATTIHIVTGTKESGVNQFFLPFGTGPDYTLDSAWVYVLQGGAEIGVGQTGNFGPMPDVTTSLTDQWVHLQMTNGEVPANEFIVYSYGGGSDFFATMTVVDLDTLARIPEAGTIFIGAFALALSVFHRYKWHPRIS